MGILIREYLVGMDSPKEDQTTEQFPFSIPMIDPIRDGKLHRISIINSTDGNNQELNGSPQTLNCPAPKLIDNPNGVMQVGVNDRVGLVNNTETAICTGRFTREDEQKPNLLKEAEQSIEHGGVIYPGKYQLSEDPGNRIGWGPC